MQKRDQPCERATVRIRPGREEAPRQDSDEEEDEEEDDSEEEKERASKKKKSRLPAGVGAFFV